MKKTKVLMFVVVLIMASFTLTGCFSNSQCCTGGVLRADFSMRTTAEQLYLDASPTKAEGYSSVEYAWEVDGTSYSGKRVDMTKPSSKTRINLIVKACTRNNTTTTDSITKTYTPGDYYDNDSDVSFSHSRIGSREYKFVGSEPSGAVYWEWKIEGKSSWYGYVNENIYTHEFSYSGNVKVELRIRDSNKNVIGQTTKIIDVY